MAEVTVKQLAGVVGIPVEKLLMQMQAAGLAHGAEDQAVSDSEKQQLLAHLKKEHGQSQGDKKITLKRKSISKLKVSGSQGKNKTVNVEVRKKRTYIKRSAVLEAEKAAAEKGAELAEEGKIKEDLVDADVKEALKNEEDERGASSAEEVVVPENESEEVSAKKSTATEEKTENPGFKDEASTGADSVAVMNVAGSSSSKRRIADTTTLKSSAKVDSKKLVSEKASVPEKKAAKPNPQNTKAREEAEEKARLETLENARRVAAELEDRSSNPEPALTTEDEQDSLVKEAFEKSIELEEKRTKRKKSDRRLKAKAISKKASQQHGFTQPTQPVVRQVQIGEQITVADLANQMSIKGVEVVKNLMKLGVMANINQTLDQETAILVAEELGHTYVLRNENAVEDSLVDSINDSKGEDGGKAVVRAPVVTIMGHVDHGKTSLLDYIRRAKVASSEAGGITQHIGAYHVETEKGMVTFLDTPGHAAFTAMRARGAKSTDIVILVVAADDGVMPQTEEAVDHARAANVPIVVAVNKIDKEAADPERVINELATKKELIPEDWGGETQYVNVSAHTGAGIDDLIEACLLQAELLELTSVDTGPAKGVVVEARLDKGRGVVSTLLVQSGELKHGDMILAGSYFGRVRAMIDELGKNINSAGPSIPVEVLGLAGTPEAGDEFLVVPDERKAREVAEYRLKKQRDQKLARQQKAKLENIFDSLKDDEKAAVNIVLKTDVRGSLEALQVALAEIGNEEVSVKIVGSGIGGINESDANLAITLNALIIGFNVRADNTARKICQDEGVEIRYYSVIYDIIDDMKAALTGLLEPELREEIIGIADVREVFRSSKFGGVAGCMVVEGTLNRNKKIRVLRDDIVVFQGELESLRRFKDDVAEVRQGIECGIAVRGYNDVKAGDKIEAYDIKEIARTL